MFDPRHATRFQNGIAAAILVAALVVGSAAVWAFAPIQRNARDTQQFTVQSGWGSSRIANELESAGLIRSSLAFTLIVRGGGIGNSLQAGTYVLSRGMTPNHIAQRIASGDALSDDIEVTIPEGMNVWEIDALLQGARLIAPGSFAREWQVSEGMLFPDTYRFPHALASSSTSYANARTIGQAFRDEAKDRTGSYDRQQVIMASLLEKEAKTPEDMALVAGIMVRREALGMPLQIDATVAYGWCLRRWLPMSSTANCDVTQAPIATEIKVDGPYNTYTRKGLPDGPISNPGLQALEAATHPQASEYLYYLSTRDGSQIIYARTLGEHLANRRKYLGF